jgi:thiamine-monophosphate kinase
VTATRASPALPFEVALIERLAAGLPRSPLQRNARHESDAELIQLPGSDALLALTIDGIVEEIDRGLYADPYLIGWMTVTASASDLAAVGATPLGVLVNAVLPPDLQAEGLTRLRQGIGDACTAYELPVLGGDTNSGGRLQTAACAVGLIPDGATLGRRGCAPGDRLYASGPLGLGAAFAILQLGGGGPTAPRPCYQPRARMREGQILRRVASCCMDTSDGALVTLDELMRLNGVGFRLEQRVEEFLDPQARRVARSAGVPPWMMLAGPHGEFELLFTVPPDRHSGLVAGARSLGWEPLDLGMVVSAPGLELGPGERSVRLDTRRARDLFAETGGDVERYLRELSRLEV